MHTFAYYPTKVQAAFVFNSGCFFYNNYKYIKGTGTVNDTPGQ